MSADSHVEEVNTDDELQLQVTVGRPKLWGVQLPEF